MKNLLIVILFFGTHLLTAQVSGLGNTNFDCNKPMILLTSLDEYEGDYEFQNFSYDKDKVSLIRYSDVNLRELFSKILEVPEDSIDIKVPKENERFLHQKITVLLNCGDIDEKTAKENLLKTMVENFKITYSVK